MKRYFSYITVILVVLTMIDTVANGTYGMFILSSVILAPMWSIYYYENQNTEN